jgi:alkane 1-monooxygenase
VGLAVTVGFIGGIGINTAHELGHKKESHERWLSKIALAQSGYGHFYIEHNRGHHVRVATPQDPASSRVGENFYQFWPRTVFGSLRSAWALERRRFARRGQHPFRLSNDVLNSWVMTIALWAVLLVWLGVGILPFLFIQAFIAITLLEAVNYLEHYGMLRQRVGAPGRERYERVDPTHSWNSNNIATNVLLYHLQRHSDHHAKPTRRYQALRDYEESPALPTGYAGMILLSLVPWAWRRVMDPRVARHFNGDMRLANIQPRKRERILSAYPIPEAAAESASTAPDPIDTSAAEVWQGRAFQCPSCRYVYDEVAGDRREGFAPGTSWALIPDTWCCPDCGVRDKVDFVVLERTDA